MKIIDYQLVAEPVARLGAIVQDWIKKGWQAFGSPFVLPPTPDLPREDTAFQAMVRYEE